MKTINRKTILCILIVALLSGIVVYRLMLPATDSAEVPGLSFRVPFRIHDQISENGIFRITDKSSSLPVNNLKTVTVREGSEILTEEQFAALDADAVKNAALHGEITNGSLSAKYYSTDSSGLSFTAYLYNSQNGKTRYFTFENLSEEEVLGILLSMKETGE